MRSFDVNRLFAQAEAAFVAGRLDEARLNLTTILRLGDNASVLHLLALVEKKRGDHDAARNAFERAAALSPGDPQILGNYANLLDLLGMIPEALRLFDKALTIAPNFTDARFNRALCLQRGGRLDESLKELDMLARDHPGEARIHSARAGVLKEQDRIDAAQAAYDRALQLQPDRPAALSGRARIALERGDDAATEFYTRALRVRPDDLELQLGLAMALEAAGGPSATTLLAEAVARHPQWVEGHEQLARMRSESGDADQLDSSYEAALATLPDNRALHISHLQTLGRAQRYGDALARINATRDRFGADPEILLIEAIFASEAGEIERADVLLERLDDGSEVRLARGRHGLRAGKFAAAARDLEKVVAAEPGNMTAWAHLSLAWRLLDDPRHEWLCGQPNLYQAMDPGLSLSELEALATHLRGLHRAHAHPIGQSLRGGTQTRGRLLLRTDPEIARLRAALEEAVRHHMAGLPAFDEAHPLLRHRERPFRLAGSWSVRLTGGGFHVSHIHPNGILSSACYLKLPGEMTGSSEHAGWLELGAPPAELGLSLAALDAIEPKPGRLVLFPSYLFHGTRPFMTGERLTVAFDVEVA